MYFTGPALIISCVHVLGGGREVWFLMIQFGVRFARRIMFGEVCWFRELELELDLDLEKELFKRRSFVRREIGERII